MQKNNLNFSPTSENALLAMQNGDLENWVQALLQSEGSLDLAKSLISEKAIAVKMYNFPLGKLKKINGPEEQVELRQPLDIWEKRVSKLTELIKGGFKPAPLIVTDFWNHFEIADGNHRHEAMLRAGINSYWTIFFIKHTKGLEYLQTIMERFNYVN